MKVSDFDKELDQVFRDIQALKTAHEKARLAQNRPLISRKVAVIQAQINLDIYLEKIKKLTERELMLLPQERALMHWGALFHARLGDLASQYDKLMTRKLWLKLIATRITGTETEDLEPDDLVELALRQVNLSKTEELLGERLQTLKRQRRELARRHRALEVAAENAQASGSLQTRLGADPVDAMTSPSVRALASFVLKLAAQAKGQSTTPEAEQRVAEVQRKYAKRADGLIEVCRSLVLGALKGTGQKPSKKVRDKFEAAMRQLDDLEAETRRACEELAHPASAIRPRVTKDFASRAT